MLNHGVTIGLILIGIWTGSQLALRGDDSIRSPVEAAPRATSQPAAEGADSKAEQVVLQLVVVELRGDAQRALKETGFRDSVTGNRFVRGSTERLESDSEGLSTVLKSMAIHADVNVLSRPQVRTFLGQSASVQISSTPGRVPYLVRTGTKSFELREADGDSPLGIKIDLTPRAADDSQQIEISPIKISITTLDGREPVRGLDLDVGKPIISTRTLETSMTLTDGAESSGMALPGPAGRQPVLFIRCKRVNTAAGASLPNPLPELTTPTGSRRQ